MAGERVDGDRDATGLGSNADSEGPIDSSSIISTEGNLGSSTNNPEDPFARFRIPLTDPKLMADRDRHINRQDIMG